MLNCYEVAKYFLSKVDEEEGEVITHLKLHKLAYYGQSASLAFFNRPLFDQDLVAWKHGPVVPELYEHYKAHRANPLPQVEELDLSRYSAVERKLLDDVYAFFGQFAAWKLRDMTHEETPWLEAFPTNAVISHKSMLEYFRDNWGDQMRAAFGPEALFQELRDLPSKPTADLLAAAQWYKQGRVAGDKYTSKAV